jgi:hypothetical protein
LFVGRDLAVIDPLLVHPFPAEPFFSSPPAGLGSWASPFAAPAIANSKARAELSGFTVGLVPRCLVQREIIRSAHNIKTACSNAGTRGSGLGLSYALVRHRHTRKLET